jgi:hypothetical protein
VEANSTGGQGSLRAVAPSYDDEGATVPEVCCLCFGTKVLLDLQLPRKCEQRFLKLLNHVGSHEMLDF